MTHKSETIHTILPERKEGAISSVVVLPEKMEFETQNPNERVFILLRRHVITNLGWVVTALISLVIPPVAFLLLNHFGINVEESFGLKSSYVLFIILVWYLLLFTNTLMKFLDWHFNIYVITNERVIDFDFSPFAYHKISETSLESIVDATQENIGFLPMLFDYGNVFIQTAGEKREFDFNAVPRPAWVRDKIMDLRDLVVKKPK